MKEYVIPEDKGRLMFYTGLNLILTVLLMVVSIASYAVSWYLLTFLCITGLWFAIKTMFRYGKKLLKNVPVCELKRNEVVIHSLPGKARILTYKQIKEVKLLRGRVSLKFFFSGKEVEHPSGWYYVGVVYPFQKGRLDEVEKNVAECLRKHGISINEVEKK